MSNPGQEPAAWAREIEAINQAFATRETQYQHRVANLEHLLTEAQALVEVHQRCEAEKQALKYELQVAIDSVTDAAAQAAELERMRAAETESRALNASLSEQLSAAGLQSEQLARDLRSAMDATAGMAAQAADLERLRSVEADIKALNATLADQLAHATAQSLAAQAESLRLREELHLANDEIQQGLKEMAASRAEVESLRAAEASLKDVNAVLAERLAEAKLANHTSEVMLATARQEAESARNLMEARHRQELTAVREEAASQLDEAHKTAALQIAEIQRHAEARIEAARVAEVRANAMRQAKEQEQIRATQAYEAQTASLQEELDSTRQTMSHQQQVLQTTLAGLQNQYQQALGALEAHQAETRRHASTATELREQLTSAQTLRRVLELETQARASANMALARDASNLRADVQRQAVRRRRAVLRAIELRWAGRQQASR